MSELDEANRRLRADYQHPERATLTVEQLAHVLGVGRSKIYDLIHCNELPVAPIRIGRRVVFSRAKVEEFLGRSGRRIEVRSLGRRDPTRGRARIPLLRSQRPSSLVLRCGLSSWVGPDRLRLASMEGDAGGEAVARRACGARECYAGTACAVADRLHPAGPIRGRGAGIRIRVGPPYWHPETGRRTRSRNGERWASGTQVPP